jgi:hypothetical protein
MRQGRTKTKVYGPLVYLLPLLFAAAVTESLSAAESFDFGRVARGTAVKRDFALANDEETEKSISRVEVTEHVQPMIDFESIRPGEQGQLRILIDTAKLPDGPYQGQVAIHWHGSSEVDRVDISGEIYSPVSIAPGPVVFLVSTRGKPLSRTVDLHNYTDTPLEPPVLEHDESRFTSTLETVAAGRHYRLVFSIRPDGPGGRHRDKVRIRSSHRNARDIELVVNTFLRERVYTFPEAIDLGALPISVASDRSSVATLAQTLMVYRPDTTDFQATVTSSLDVIDLRAERGPAGDRYEVTLTLVPERVRPGAISGVIRISTNDPEFELLEVPLSGHIIDRP